MLHFTNLNIPFNIMQMRSKNMCTKTRKHLVILRKPTSKQKTGSYFEKKNTEFSHT